MADLPSYYPRPAPPPHYSHYYPQLPPPPPPPGVAPPPAQPYHHPANHYHPHPPPPSAEELRTLFIAGLPDDTKPREIYNLFRHFPGYESCQLRSSGNTSKAYAFAVFTDQHSAVAAMRALNGLVFDYEKDLSLHIELAKSNSRGKRERTDDEWLGSGKKVRGSAVSSWDFSSSGVGSNSHVPGMVNSGHNSNGYTSSQSHLSFNYGAVGGSEFRKNSSATSVPQSNAPCQTLFVANLGPRCSEQELTKVFSSCPGFLELKIRRKSDTPVAFINFKDEICSTRALNSLQGFRLHSSDEGMRLEYAKAQMGQKKNEKS